MNHTDEEIKKRIAHDQSQAVGFGTKAASMYDDPMTYKDRAVEFHSKQAAYNEAWDKQAQSDGSTASYYELPEGAKELQDVISYKDMNGQIAEIFRACMRYGEVAHSPKMRDAKKIKFYIDAEIERLETYASES